MRSEDTLLPLWNYKVSALHGLGHELIMRNCWIIQLNTSGLEESHACFCTKCLFREMFDEFYGEKKCFTHIYFPRSRMTLKWMGLKERSRGETWGEGGRHGILWLRWPFFSPISSTLGKHLNKENILSPVTCSLAWGGQSYSADWGQECISKDGHHEPCFISWHRVQIYEDKYLQYREEEEI